MSVKRDSISQSPCAPAKTPRMRSYIEREREWLAQSRATASNAPFRHPQDVAFFGEYHRSAA